MLIPPTNSTLISVWTSLGGGDSPLSEWLQPPTEDHIDETIAYIGTGIGMEVPLIDEAAASRNP